MFALLLHHYKMNSLKCKVYMYMEGTSWKRNIIDIGATAAKHKEIVLQLLAMHALTGCDTVSHLWNVGKNTALKVLTKGQGLQLLGTEGTNLTEVVREATEFIAACYGSKEKSSLSTVWYQV